MWAGLWARHQPSMQVVDFIDQLAEAVAVELMFHFAS